MTPEEIELKTLAIRLLGMGHMLGVHLSREDLMITEIQQIHAAMRDLGILAAGLEQGTMTIQGINDALDAVIDNALAPVRQRILELSGSQT